jgi:hypothetical protein
MVLAGARRIILNRLAKNLLHISDAESAALIKELDRIIRMTATRYRRVS